MSRARRARRAVAVAAAVATAGATACKQPTSATLFVVLRDGETTTDAQGEPGDTGVLDPDGDPDAAPPTLDGVDAVEAGSVLAVSFVAGEGDATLIGGTLDVTYAGATFSYAIPGDLATYSPSGAWTVWVPRPGLGACALGGLDDLSLRLTDADGVAYTSPTVQVATGDYGLILDEPPAGYVDVLVDPAPGTVLCGEIAVAANDGDTYIGDTDLVGISVSANRALDLELDWDQAADYDLLVFDLAMQLVTGSATQANAGPETVTAALPAGNYLVDVAAWSGAAGGWTLTLDP